jgi:hypothetical protein
MLLNFNVNELNSPGHSGSSSSRRNCISLPLSLVLSVYCWIRRSIIKFNLVSTSRTLNILFEPSPKAVEVKNVTTLELLGLRDLLEADDAGFIDTRSQISWSVHIWKFFQF